jgi:hypothetical protein
VTCTPDAGIVVVASAIFIMVGAIAWVICIVAGAIAWVIKRSFVSNTNLRSGQKAFTSGAWFWDQNQIVSRNTSW